MKTRNLGTFFVNQVGLGCMGMSHGYGKPVREISQRTLHAALDLGYNFLDTAALYGFGENEKLIGETIAHRRHEYFLASKCGLIGDSNGKRCLDARPEIIRQTCEESLRNLKTDFIDLYYLHRVDQKVALEDQIGALADLVREGKVRSIGLSEVSAKTLRAANAIHKISALQSEYSLWTRNPELNIFQTCEELNVSFVAFSPLGRGFLTGRFSKTHEFDTKDLRSSMPRFSSGNLVHNINLLHSIQTVAEAQNCTQAQVALAWIFAKQKAAIVIPGTTNSIHAAENFAAQSVSLTHQQVEQLDLAFRPDFIHGERYDQATLATMET